MKEGDIFGSDFNNSQDRILTTTYTYDNNGNLKTVTTPENVTTTYEYNNMDMQTGSSRPGQDESGNPVTITGSTIYDEQGNVTSSTDTNSDTTNVRYLGL